MLVALIYSEWNDVESMVDEEPEVTGSRDGTQVSVYYFDSNEEGWEFRNQLRQSEIPAKVRTDEVWDDPEDFMLDVLAEEA